MRKRLLTAAAILLVLLSMSACAGGYSNTDPESSQESTEQSAQQSQAVLQSESSLSDQIIAAELETDEAIMTEQLSENYMDIDSLPVLDIDIEDTYVFDDRTISLEDSIDHEIELLAYNYYYYSSSGEYEKLADLFGDNPSLQNAISNEEANFKEGLYKSEYIIHKLTTLTVNDLLSTSASYKQKLLNHINTYGFDRFAVVRVDVSWKHNELSLSKGPQLGDGEYTRYFLAANNKDMENFNIYEIYWEDFLP